MKNDALLKKKEERRFLKKAGFGKEHAGLGGLAAELYGPASSDPGQGRSTPRLAAPKLRGSGAAKRTLTDLCCEAREQAAMATNTRKAMELLAKEHVRLMDEVQERIERCRRAMKRTEVMDWLVVVAVVAWWVSLFFMR